MRIRNAVVFINLLMVSAVPSLLFSQTKPVVRVPFVGCPSDGQVGLIAAPKGTDKQVQLDPVAAKKLAYYKAEYSPGVLAPMGWNCFCMYGSNGSTLLVAPQPLKREELFYSNWRGITGSGVQVSVSEGDTSGRFEVARMIARVFPKERAFVQKIIAEELAPARDFTFGHFPTDKLVYKNDRAVEYRSPPNTEGLGTMSRLKESSLPIDGVAILMGEPPSLLFLAVRLPADKADLSLSIIQQVERENREKAKQ